MQWGRALNADITILHAIEHDEHVSHHHDGDGAIHYDNSDASAEHSGDHPGSPQPAALILSFDAAMAPQRVMETAADLCSFLPGLTPHCPYRPPAAALG